MEKPARTRIGRAAALVKQMSDAGISQDAIAREIHLPLETLSAYVAGAQPMPLNVQARIALYMIAKVPAFLREGNQLRGQVAAAIQFETRITSARQSDARL